MLWGTWNVTYTGYVVQLMRYTMQSATKREQTKALTASEVKISSNPGFAITERKETYQINPSIKAVVFVKY